MIFDVSVNIQSDTMPTCQSLKIDCDDFPTLFLRIDQLLTYFQGTVSSINIVQMAKLEKERRKYEK